MNDREWSHILAMILHLPKFKYKAGISRVFFLKEIYKINDLESNLNLYIRVAAAVIKILISISISNNWRFCKTVLRKMKLYKGLES